MTATDTLEMENPVAQADNRIQLPVGILGFEPFKEYMLLANPAEAPFAWLRVTGNANLSFVVINPFLIVPDYAPDIPETDVEFLGLKDPTDALLFNIVTVWGSNHATVN